MEKKTEKTAFRIRMAKEEDAAALLAIYAPYILETAITFEYDVPTEEEFRARIRHILEKYPYLVAETDGEIVGYSYAKEFGERAAFSRSAETVIYLRKDARGNGIGRLLYDELITLLRQQNVTNVNAAIAFVQRQDEHLSDASPNFHEAYGFRKVAHFQKCGYKFGKWYDLIWMEKFIGEHTASPEEFSKISDILLPKNKFS